MNSFFWSCGHLGWGIFALSAFSGLWLLLFDLIWRLKSIKIGRLVATMSVGWIIGAGLILLGFYLGNQ